MAAPYVYFDKPATFSAAPSPDDAPGTVKQTICVCQFQGLRGPSARGVHAALPGFLYCQQHLTIMRGREATAQAKERINYRRAIEEQIRLKEEAMILAEAQAEMARRMQQRTQDLDIDVMRMQNSRPPSSHFAPTNVPAPMVSNIFAAPHHVPKATVVSPPHPKNLLVDFEEAEAKAEAEAAAHDIMDFDTSKVHNFMPEMIKMVDAWRQLDQYKKMESLQKAKTAADQQRSSQSSAVDELMAAFASSHI